MSVGSRLSRSAATSRFVSPRIARSRSCSCRDLSSVRFSAPSAARMSSVARLRFRTSGSVARRAASLADIRESAVVAAAAEGGERQQR